MKKNFFAVVKRKWKLFVKKVKKQDFFKRSYRYLSTNYQQISFKVKKSNWYKRGINPILWPYIIVMILLIALPLLIIFLYSLVQPTGDSLVFKLNFANFVDFFSHTAFVLSLFIAIGYAFLSSLVAIIIAYPVAYVMAFCKSKILSKNIWILVTLPIWINMLLKIIGLQTLFNIVAPGLLGTPISIIVGMVYAFLPFVILPIYNSLDKIDHSLIEASKDLGANGWKTFWKVIFRQSIPGILAGGTLLLVNAATSLLIVRYMGNGQITMIVEIIESYFFKGNNFGLGAAISVILAIFVFIIIVVSGLFSRHFDNPKKRGGRYNEKIS